MAQNVIVYPSGSTNNAFPHIQFSGENGYYFIEMNEDALLYSYQPNIPTSGLTFYLDAAAYDSYSGGTLWWDLTEGKYLIGDGNAIYYDGIEFNSPLYQDKNRTFKTNASSLLATGVNVYYFSDISSYGDINFQNTYYDDLVAENYPTIYVKIYKTADPTYYQVYSGSNASIVANYDLGLQMVRIGGNASWDGSDIASYPYGSKGLVSIEFIPSRNGGTIQDTKVSADLVNTPYFNPVNGGVFRFDGTNEYARALDPNVMGGGISRTMIGFFSAATSESGCIFGMGDQPQNNGGSGTSWELWNYNNTSGLRLHYEGGNLGVSGNYLLQNNLNKWLMAVISYNSDTNTATVKIYDAGTVYSGSGTPGQTINTYTNNISINKSAYDSEGGGMTGNFAILLYYERELSSTELDKIYSVFGPRFGL